MSALQLSRTEKICKAAALLPPAHLVLPCKKKDILATQTEAKTSYHIGIRSLPSIFTAFIACGCRDCLVLLCLTCWVFLRLSDISTPGLPSVSTPFIAWWFHARKVYSCLPYIVFLQLLDISGNDLSNVFGMYRWQRNQLIKRMQLKKYKD